MSAAVGLGGTKPGKTHGRSRARRLSGIAEPMESANEAETEGSDTLQAAASLLGIPEAEFTPHVREAVMALIRDVERLMREVEETRARLSAVYSIIAGLTAPFFIFVMPRIMSGLHPGAKGDESGSTPVAQLHMPPNMLTVFFLSLIGFTLLFVWMLNVRVRLARIEYQQSVHHA